MLKIIEDYTSQNGTVKVVSGKNGRQVTIHNSDNIFILDYEDYLLLKDSHFYFHPNGTYITRIDGHQRNLNRVIAWKRGFFDLYKHPKMFVKHLDGDKTNLSKRNIKYYFNEDTYPVHEPQILYRGVIATERGTFTCSVPVKDRLVEDIDEYKTQADAYAAYQHYLRKIKRDEMEAWL